MLVSVKQFLKSTSVWGKVLNPIRSASEISGWQLNGRPVPPPHSIKVRNILCLADLFGIDVLIETGTFRGDMIAATKDRFKRIVSFEIFEPLAKSAKHRFQNDSNVEIILGDSANELPAILARTHSPAIFWLDGHYSGGGTGKGISETPVLSELAHIHRLREKFQDVIIIDDARAFGTEPDYPPLGRFLMDAENMFGRRPLVANDSIFLLPRSDAGFLPNRTNLSE
jgi:hypothetical protein